MQDRAVWKFEDACKNFKFKNKQNSRVFALRKHLLEAVKRVDSFLPPLFEWWCFNIWKRWLWISASFSFCTPTLLTGFPASFSFNFCAFVDRSGVVLLRYMLHYCFVYYPVNFSMVSSLSLLDPSCISNATLTARLPVLPDLLFISIQCPYDLSQLWKFNCRVEISLLELILLFSSETVR